MLRPRPSHKLCKHKCHFSSRKTCRRREDEGCVCQTCEGKCQDFDGDDSGDDGERVGCDYCCDVEGECVVCRCCQSQVLSRKFPARYLDPILPLVRALELLVCRRILACRHIPLLTNNFAPMILIRSMGAPEECQSLRLHAASVIVYFRSSVPGISQTCSSAPSAGFLATYWVPGAIGHSIPRPENPILTESQSSLGVPRPKAFTPVSSPAGARR